MEDVIVLSSDSDEEVTEVSNAPKVISSSQSSSRNERKVAIVHPTCIYPAFKNEFGPQFSATNQTVRRVHLLRSGLGMYNVIPLSGRKRKDAVNTDVAVPEKVNPVRVEPKVKPWSDKTKESFGVLEKIRTRQPLSDIVECSDGHRPKVAPPSKAAVALRSLAAKHSCNKNSAGDAEEPPHLLSVVLGSKPRVQNTYVVPSQLLSSKGNVCPSLSKVSQPVTNNRRAPVMLPTKPFMSPGGHFHKRLTVVPYIGTTAEKCIEAIQSAVYQRRSQYPQNHVRTILALARPTNTSVSSVSDAHAEVESANDPTVVEASVACNTSASETVNSDERISTSESIRNNGISVSLCSSSSSSKASVSVVLPRNKTRRGLVSLVEVDADFRVPRSEHGGRQVSSRQGTYLKRAISAKTLSRIMQREFQVPSARFTASATADSRFFTHGQEAVVYGYLRGGEKLSPIAIDVIADFANFNVGPSRSLLLKLFPLLSDASNDVVIENVWIKLQYLRRLHCFRWDLPCWEYLVSSVAGTTSDLSRRANCRAIKFVLDIISDNFSSCLTTNGQNSCSNTAVQKVLGVDVSFSNLKAVLEWHVDIMHNHATSGLGIVHSNVLCFQQLLTMMLAESKDLENDCLRIAEMFRSIYPSIGSLTQRKQYISSVQPLAVRVLLLSLLMNYLGDAESIPSATARTFVAASLSISKILEYYFKFEPLGDEPGGPCTRLGVDESWEELVYVLENLLSSYVYLIEECHSEADGSDEKQALHSELCSISGVKAAVDRLEMNVMTKCPSAAGSRQLRHLLTRMRLHEESPYVSFQA